MRRKRSKIKTFEVRIRASREEFYPGVEAEDEDAAERIALSMFKNDYGGEFDDYRAEAEEEE